MNYSGKCSESYKVGVKLAEKCNKSGINKLIFVQFSTGPTICL